MALAVVLLAARPARAVGEDEWQLAGRLGVGDLHIDNRSPVGATAVVELEYGLTDAWAARVMLGTGFHPVDKRMSDNAPEGTVRATAALIGLTYTFDVLRMVPYAQMAVGLVNFAGAVFVPRSSMAAELGLGADYWLTKRWGVGGTLQYLFTPIDLFDNLSELGKSPFSFALAFRGSWLF
jgi:hypothetical protein